MAISRGDLRRRRRVGHEPATVDQFDRTYSREEIEETNAYRAYIKSGAWLLKREDVFAANGRRCTRCGTGAQLQVHHRTYERLGCEELRDLEVLCAPCHRTHHRGTTLMVLSSRVEWAFRPDVARATRGDG